MKKSTYLIVISFLLAINYQQKAQTSGSEANIKAVLIYNFTRFFYWPEGVIKDEFNIGIIGNKKIAEALSIIAEKKAIKNMPTVIEETNSIDSILRYNMIYLSGESQLNISSVVSKIGNKSVLLITEEENACDIGSSINLIKRNGNIKFEINLTALKKSGIESNSQFVKLAHELFE